MKTRLMVSICFGVVQLCNSTFAGSAPCPSVLPSIVVSELDISVEQSQWAQRVLATAQQHLHMRMSDDFREPDLNPSMKAAIKIIKSFAEVADRLDISREHGDEKSFKQALSEFDALRVSLQRDLELVSAAILPLSRDARALGIVMTVELLDPSGFSVLPDSEASEPRHSQLENLLSVLVKNVQELSELGYTRIFEQELQRLSSVGDED